MSDELPEGWAGVPLANVSSSIQYGYTASADARGDGPRLLRITDIQNGKVDWSSVPSCKIDGRDLAKYQLKAGDIVFARSGATTGKSFLIESCPIEAVFASYLIRVRAAEGALDPSYLSLAFRTPEYWTYITDNMAGNAQPNCNGSKLAALPIRIAPLPEQGRIVDAVEALFEQVDHARERLDRVPLILRRFRQAVLAAACSGKLTEDWRELRDRDVDRWERSTVVEVCSAIVDTPHTTPKWTASGELCLRTTNFFVTGLALEEVRYVSPYTYKVRVARLVPAPGDIVYSREGGILGIACVIPAGVRACLGQRMMLMRGDASRVRPGYLCAVLNSPATNATVRELTGGSASPHLNVGDIKRFEVPLPPLDEQDEILTRLSKLWALANTIERRVQAASTRADRLPQAILSKAFSGELVPTEAELARAEGRMYETAGELLARVSATSTERVAGTSTKRTGSARRKRAAHARKTTDRV